VVEVAFYGDDFTGSTDALLQFHRFGLRGLLLTGLPAPGQLRELARDYDVVGLAGVARSLPTGLVEAEIRPGLTALAGISPRIVQYKICSTADSAPQLGSIGKALEVGRDIFGNKPIPVLAAQPELGRFTAFGHHFAAEAGAIYRLDRQPTMSHHPATPMTESDLRRHIGAQTTLSLDSLDLTAYAAGLSGALDRYRALSADAVVFDAVDSDQLGLAARVMLAHQPAGPIFAVGSGGLSYGIGSALDRELRPDPSILAPTGQVLCVSGSCSARTARQISAATRHGWIDIPIDPTADSPWLDRQVRQAFHSGAPGVIVHTGSFVTDIHSAQLLAGIGRSLARVIRDVAANTGVRRIIVAGGDTSGRVLRELRITAAEVQCAVGVGAAMCLVRSADPLVDGLEIVLKGGQVGDIDFFDNVRSGCAP
jgi:uncharacterized protein YgbK (DUF1537 family)